MVKFSDIRNFVRNKTILRIHDSSVKTKTVPVYFVRAEINHGDWLYELEEEFGEDYYAADLTDEQILGLPSILVDFVSVFDNTAFMESVSVNDKDEKFYIDSDSGNWVIKTSSQEEADRAKVISDKIHADRKREEEIAILKKLAAKYPDELAKIAQENSSPPA